MPANPNGGSHFYAGVSQLVAAVTNFSRAERPVTLTTAIMSVEFDVCCSYIGVGTPSNNIGSWSLQPSATATYPNILARWPVGATNPHASIGPDMRRPALFQRRTERFALLGHHEAEERIDRRPRRVRREAQQAKQAVRPDRTPVREDEIHVAELGDALRLGESLAALARRAQRSVSLGHVDARSEEADGPSDAVEARRDPLEDPLGAVLADAHGVFRLGGGPANPRLLDRMLEVASPLLRHVDEKTPEKRPRVRAGQGVPSTIGVDDAPVQVRPAHEQRRCVGQLAPLIEAARRSPLRLLADDHRDGRGNDGRRLEHAAAECFHGILAVPHLHAERRHTQQ